MKLQDEIRKFNEQALPNIPPEVIKVMTEAAEDLANTGIASRALAEGDEMPPFALPDATGKIVSSEQLLEKGALVISFYRGSW